MIKTPGMIFKVILGLFFLMCAAFLLLKLQWWRQTWLLFEGSAAPLLVLAGIVTLVIAKE